MMEGKCREDDLHSASGSQQVAHRTFSTANIDLTRMLSPILAEQQSLDCSVLSCVT